MRISTNRKVWQYMFVVAALLFSVISFLFYIKPVFAALVLGILITVFLDRIIDLFYKMTEKCSSEQRKAIAVICSVVIVSVVSVFLISGAFTLLNNFNEIVETLEDFNHQYNETAEELAGDLSNITNETFPSLPDFGDAIPLINDSSKLQTASGPPDNSSSADGFLNFDFSRSRAIELVLISGGSVLSSTTSSISVLFSTMFALCLIVPIMAGYYFKTKGKIRSKIVSLAPNKYKDAVSITFKNIVNDMSTYTVMKTLEVFVITFFYCVGFSLVGLPHGILIGLIMGLSNVVPYVGFLLPAIPVVVYSYTIGPEIMLAVIGIMIVLQVIDYFFILPNIVMKTVKVSSFTAVILTLAGFKLFGIFGLIFAVPIYIFCKIVMIACYKVLVIMYPDPPDPNEAILDEG